MGNQRFSILAMVTPRIINSITMDLSQSCSSRPLPSTLDLVEFRGRLCITLGIPHPDRKPHSVPSTYIRPHCPMMRDIIPNFSPQFTLDLQFHNSSSVRIVFAAGLDPTFEAAEYRSPCFGAARGVCGDLGDVAGEERNAVKNVS